MTTREVKTVITRQLACLGSHHGTLFSARVRQEAPTIRHTVIWREGEFKNGWDGGEKNNLQNNWENQWGPWYYFRSGQKPVKRFVNLWHIGNYVLFHMLHRLFGKNKCWCQGHGGNSRSVQYVINSDHDDSYMLLALNGSGAGCAHCSVFAADPWWAEGNPLVPQISETTLFEFWQPSPWQRHFGVSIMYDHIFISPKHSNSLA